MLGWLKGTPGLLLRTLKDAEWKPLLDFVTPAFFEVMPARALLGQGRELVGNARDRKRFATVRRRMQQGLDELGVPVRLGPPGAGSPPPGLGELAEPERRARGQRVLELYFAQLLAGDVAILDLRPDRFAALGEGGLAWHPGPYYVDWDPGFVDAVRRLYRGFYRDDEGSFQEALADLELQAAGDLFIRHFGEGDQRAVRFDRRTFQRSFHDIFVRCRDTGASLHPNFLALGVYLATLYDHLAELQVPLDVRAAFDRVADG